MAVLEPRVSTALVTGGASGLGFAIAARLAGAGARVALLDRDAAPLERAVAKLRTAGARVHGIRMDVTETGCWPAVLAEVAAELGPIDILIANAGIAAPFTPIEQIEPALWRHVFDVNVHSQFALLQAWLPQARGRAAEGRAGHVLLTASLGAFLVVPGNAAYSAAKAAIVALAEGLRAELASLPIGVSIFCPGLVRTALMDTSTRHLHAAGFETAAMDPAVVAAKASMGLPVEMAAERAVAGMLAGRFWLFTHDDLMEHVAQRSRDIADGA